MKKVIVTIFAYLIFLSVIVAQEWKQYLPNYNQIPKPADITVIEIDRFNNKWIGTSGYDNQYGNIGGLVKFDGTNWKQYTKLNSDLPDGHITAIAFDQHDNTWVGMKDSGIVVIKNDTIKKIYEPYKFFDRGRVKEIVVDKDNNMWFLFHFVFYSNHNNTHYALMKYDGSKWQNYNLDSLNFPENSINCITVDNKNNLFCGGQDALIKFNGTSWEVIDAMGEDTRLSISTLAFDNNGKLWVGTSGFAGVSVPKLLLFDSEKWIIMAEEYLSGEPSAILFDKFGDSWVSSLSGGVGLKSEEGLATFNGSNWIYYNRKNSPILSSDVSSMALDSNGVLWIGTFRGVCTFDNSKWHYYSSTESLPRSYVNKVVVDNENNKWIGTNGFGLVKYDGQLWSTFDKSNSNIPDNTINDIEIDNDKKLWVATEIGLGVFDGISWMIFNDENTEYPLNNIIDVEIDSKGLVWVTVFRQSAIFRFDGNSWEIFDSQNSPIPDSYFYGQMEVDLEDKLWLGTHDGAHVFDGIDWISYNPTNSPLPDDYVQCFAFDSSGNTWIGTIDGLAKINGNEWEVFTSENTEYGGHSVSNIAIDSQNNVWISVFNGQGISKYDGTAWHNYNNRFDPALGGINVESIDFDRDNNLWLAAYYQGMVQFNEDKIVSTSKTQSKSNNFILLNNYPNPFNPTTTINYSIPNIATNFSQPIKLIVYDILGENVKTFVNEHKQSGNYSITFDASKLSSGVYYYQLKAGDFMQTRKMLLLK